MNTIDHDCVDTADWFAILVIVLSWFGILGNLFAIIIVCTGSMRKYPVTILIVGLAISDTALLIVINFILGAPLVLQKDFTCFGDYDMPYTACESLSVNFILAINIERYIAVCHPFECSRLCSRKHQVYFVFAIIVISFIESVIPWVILQLELSQYISGLVDTILVASFTCIIPFTIIIWVNIKIFIAIRKSRKRIYRLSTMSSNLVAKVANEFKSSTTKMLLSVVFVFIICYSVVLAWELGWFYCIIMEGKGNSHCYNIWFKFGIFAGTLNSSVNFIIYCTMGKEFRQSVGVCMNSIWTNLQQKRSSRNSVNTNSCNNIHNKIISNYNTETFRI